MAASTARILTRKYICQCLSVKPPRRFASNDIQFSLAKPESANHCSGSLERLQFTTESRGLYIQQSLAHLKSLESVRIKESVKQISINDQYKSKGLDEKSLFLYDKIPPLKYNNPHVPIICTKDETKPWELNVSFDTNETIEVSLEGKTSEEIFSTLCDLICDDH